MKRKLLIGLLCFMSFTTTVYAEEYSETFKKLTTDGTIQMPSIKPSNEIELDFMGSASIATKAGEYGWLSECNEDYSECNVTLESTGETHKVKLVWQQEDATIKSVISGYLNQIESTRPVGEEGEYKSIYYQVSDLNLVNYFSHVKDDNSTTDMNNVVLYSKELRDSLGNINVTYYLDMRAGEDMPMIESGFGGLTLFYNGVAYGCIDRAGVKQQAVIYIPDETENTSTAYIAAAQKRISEYLGQKVEITEAGTRADSEYDWFDELGDESKMGDYYYNIKVGNVTKPFVILRDSSKIEKPVLETKDAKTNISISTESAQVPLDTSIQVEEVKKETETFTKIMDTLKLENEENQVYDFKLYSNTANNYVSNLATGEFVVSVPLNSNLKGKNLVAYYVTDDNEVEEHPVTEENGNGVFTTNHFSIYTIAEKVETEDDLTEEVPKTFDGITNYVIVGLVGVLGVTGTVIASRKKEVK